jgi:hypothetical protein
MNCITRSLYFTFFLIATMTRTSSAAVECVADGTTDVTECLQNALDAAHANGSLQVNLSNGSYLINGSITIPDGVQFIGKGRGDQGYIGTVLVAGETFPLHGTMVQMGTPGMQNFGVVIKGMTLDGKGRPDYLLENLNAGARSRGEDLLLVNFLAAGLHVDGSGATGSGPFQDLEIYPLDYSTAATNCILVQNVPHFLGVESATCNGGNGLGMRPAVALQADGDGVYSDFHVESFVTAYQFGSATHPADGIIARNGQFGPNVDTGVTITSSTANQNISLFGISCYSCSLTLNDLVTGNAHYWAIGYYLEGAGLPISNRKIFSSDAGTANNLGGQSAAVVAGSVIHPNTTTAKPQSRLRFSSATAGRR